jgi:hypothetical protein
MTAGRRRKVKAAAKKLKAGAEEMAEAAAMPGAGSDSDDMAMAPMGGRKARSRKGMLGRLSRYF